MPKSKNSSFTRPVDRLQVLVSSALPSQASSDEMDEPSAHVRNEENLCSLPKRKLTGAAPMSDAAEEFVLG